MKWAYFFFGVGIVLEIIAMVSLITLGQTKLCAKGVIHPVSRARYEEGPGWTYFCRLIFAVSTLAFIVSFFFGPAILSEDIIGFWIYQHWALTSAGLPYVVLVAVTFALAVISGIPDFLYEKERMKRMENEA